jgi:hypothetical protein
MFVKLSTGEIVNADHILNVSRFEGHTVFEWTVTEYGSRLPSTSTPGLADYHLFETIAAWQAGGGEKAA